MLAKGVLRHSFIPVLAVIIMSVWYFRVPFGRLWINAGDSWDDGQVLNNLANRSTVPWSQTALFPVWGVVKSGEPELMIKNHGYGYIYTHYPSGPDWAAYLLDFIGLKPLWSKQMISLVASLLGVFFWSIAWGRERGNLFGILFFSITVVSGWFLKLSPSLHQYPYTILVSGIMFWILTPSSGWRGRRIVTAWFLLLLGTQISHPMTVWSVCLVTGLVLTGLVPANWRHWLFLMTAPLMGLGSHFLRIFWLDPIYGVPDLMDAFVVRTGGASWIGHFSPRYFALLALRTEYWSGFGFFVLLALFGFKYLHANREGEETRVYSLILVLLLSGVAWWVVFPGHTWAHGGAYVDFFVGFAAASLWAWLLDRGSTSLLNINKKLRLLYLLLMVGLIFRIIIGYMDKVVAFPERLLHQAVSGPCITDTPYLPALEAMLNASCPTLGDTGGRISMDLDNCSGDIVSGVYVHLDEVPRINVPIVTQFYVQYQLWKANDSPLSNRSMTSEFSVPGQPDAPLVWSQQPVSWYEPVLYCVDG